MYLFRHHDRMTTVYQKKLEEAKPTEMRYYLIKVTAANIG